MEKKRYRCEKVEKGSRGQVEMKMSVKKNG